MTTQHRNFKNISGGSRNDALPMYIHLKIPKSREIVSLRACDNNSSLAGVYVTNQKPPPPPLLRKIFSVPAIRLLLLMHS